MKRLPILFAASVAALTAAITVLFRPAPRLIWNASASVPIGLYAVRPAGTLHVGELVIIAPPERLASFLAERGYLPRSVPLLKYILALPGQTVCRADRSITVDGAIVGEALERDRRDRALPGWQGCRAVPDGQVFLMNRQSRDSLDGRYFGVIPVTTIIGRAAPLWTNSEGR